MEPLPDLVSILLGPLGALAAALFAVRVLWQRCTKLEAEAKAEREKLETELRAERAARLQDAQTTADRLLGTWGKVSGAIETLERLSSFDLPGVSVPPASKEAPAR